MNDDLVVWLRAQLDEDEAMARATIATTTDGFRFTERFASLPDDETYLTGQWWACPAKWNRYTGPAQVVRVQIHSGEHADADPTHSAPGPYVIICDDVDKAPVIEWISRHDPARVLREVAAMRAILDDYEAAGHSREISPDAWVFLRDAVRRFASVYADRPGYREEWKP